MQNGDDSNTNSHPKVTIHNGTPQYIGTSYMILPIRFDKNSVTEQTPTTSTLIWRGDLNLKPVKYRNLKSGRNDVNSIGL